jgi:ABC-type antimicrobial peptide transport system permease subunit
MLASLGLYGMIAQTVSQRQREIGIRAALGASPRDVFGLIARDGARIAAAAIAIGLALAALGIRAAAAWISDPMAHEAVRLRHAPLVVTTVVAILGAAIALASFWPARRAARIDPMHVLRNS